MRRWALGLATAQVPGSEPQVAAQDHLAGVNLCRDVARYASFGLHGFGTEGDRAAEWIATELRTAGFQVEFQPVVLGRQYVVEHACRNGRARATLEATPFWWRQADKRSFRLTAPLARDSEVTRKIGFGVSARRTRAVPGRTGPTGSVAVGKIAERCGNAFN